MTLADARALHVRRDHRALAERALDAAIELDKIAQREPGDTDAVIEFANFLSDTSGLVSSQGPASLHADPLAVSILSRTIEDLVEHPLGGLNEVVRLLNEYVDKLRSAQDRSLYAEVAEARDFCIALHGALLAQETGAGEEDWEAAYQNEMGNSGCRFC